MQRGSYVVIHVVLSRSFTFYLQPNKLELLGDLDSVEDQCQQDVSVKYLFFIIATSLHKEFGNKRESALLLNSNIKIWLIDQLSEKLFSLHII